ncbi:hypothetical protein D3C78_1453750 [compost metagenome]
MKRCRVVDHQHRFALFLLQAPAQLWRRIHRTALEGGRAIEDFDARAHGDFQGVGVGLASQRDFLGVEVEDRFAVLRQIAGDFLDAHHLLFARIEAKQRRGGHERGRSGVVVGLGVDPGLHRVWLGGGVADRDRGIAFVAVVHDTRAAEHHTGLAETAE